MLATAVEINIEIQVLERYFIFYFLFFYFIIAPALIPLLLMIQELAFSFCFILFCNYSSWITNTISLINGTQESSSHIFISYLILTPVLVPFI